MVRVFAILALSGLLFGSSCQPDDAVLLPERRQTVAEEPGLELIARFIHVTDTHVVDEESPARFAGAHDLVHSAWRSWESSSTQITDGIIRTANRIHASGRPIDFLVHGGDSVDNVQRNELAWFMALMEGGHVNPLTGPDDRAPQNRPIASLDPHVAFDAQGLYQQGVHGELPSIPWYILAGNHDIYSIGVFPIQTLFWGGRQAMLPLQPRAGFFLPTVLDPTGSWTHGKVTPAHPGPPELFDWPLPVVPVADRAYFSLDEFLATMRASRTLPAGHGFNADGLPWYSVTVGPGLRLIGLYTSDIPEPVPTMPSHEASISAEQLDWLRAELEASTARNEIVIVATHHPSGSLETYYGSAADPDSFRALLNEFPSVVLHLAGHLHRNRVADRGNYIEIETCSTLDWPQEARVVELWRDADGGILVGYEMFSHVQEDLPPLGDDPLFQLRSEAYLTAKPQADMSRSIDDSAGSTADREGLIRVR